MSKTNKVIIIVRDGMVLGVFADDSKALDVEVCDLDLQGVEDFERCTELQAMTKKMKEVPF